MKKELNDRIIIEKVSNGYMLRWKQETYEGTYREIIDVYEEDETRGELEIMRSVLWDVLEHFGVYKGIEVRIEEELDQ